MLLSWVFISSYTTIYFFLKKFLFPKIYISVNAIFECLCLFFCLRNERSIKYVRNCWLDEGSSKMGTALYRRKRCHTLCVPRTYTILFMFWQHFCFIVSCFPCRNLTLPLFKKDVFVTNCYFSLKRSIFNITKWALFT